MGTTLPPLDLSQPLSVQIFRGGTIVPPNGVLVGAEDSLYLWVWASYSTKFSIATRVIGPDGVVQLSNYDIVPTATRTSFIYLVPVGQGLLVSAIIQALTGSVYRRGQIYCQLLLTRGQLSTNPAYTALLCGGYLTTSQPLSYPFNGYDPNFSGRGNIRSITGTTPGVGGEISETVPAGAFWTLLSFSMNMATAAGGSARSTFLQISDGTSRLYYIPPAGTTAAAGGSSIFYMPGALTVSAAGPNLVQALPMPCVLPAGFKITTTTVNLGAGDQYSAVQYEVEEWLQL